LSTPDPLDSVKLSKRGAQKNMFVSELTVKLSWHADVDLDLMAFYKTKSGEVGGVYSSMYSDSGQGSLTKFPYMMLDQDAGVGGGAGEKVETLKIKQFDEMAEIYFVAMNFTDASRNASSAFSQFDGRVEVSNEKGESITVVLASNDEGSTAVFARIEHSNELLGAVLTNESRVYAFNDFRAALPGADQLSLANKILLQGRGDKAQITSTSGTVSATLRWKAEVDLDLHCFYVTKAQPAEPSSGGFFSRLFGGGGSSGESTSGHIYFGSLGRLDKSPYIELDQDAGVGDKGGDNEENMRFGDISKIDQAIIVANIFNKPNARFSTYDGSVVLRAGEQQIEVPLMESDPGAWCVIAQIDNRSGVPSIVNLNQVQKNRPSSDDLA
jgi:tellurite resistance protein TerA